MKIDRIAVALLAAAALAGCGKKAEAPRPPPAAAQAPAPAPAAPAAGGTEQAAAKPGEKKEEAPEVPDTHGMPGMSELFGDKKK
jgi:hypothetical protein